jgi:hypothetical protein
MSLVRGFRRRLVITMPERETSAGTGGLPSSLQGLEAVNPIQTSDLRPAVVSDHEPAQTEATIKLVVDTQVCDQLLGPEVTLELCDDAGRTLGHFVGCFVPSPEALPWAYEWAKGAFSEEEIERAKQQPGGRTIHEILQRLERS